MDFNSNNISKTVNEFEKESKKVERSYNSRWNDEVHSSFESFMIMCNKNTRKLVDISSKCAEVCKDLNGLKIDEEIKTSNQLVKKADNLAKIANNLAGRVI